MNLLEQIDAKISQELVVMLTTESAKRRAEARIELIKLHIEKGIVDNMMAGWDLIDPSLKYTTIESLVRTEANKEYWMGSNGIKSIYLEYCKTKNEEVLK